MTDLLRGGDSVNVGEIPAGLDVYWFYADGRFAETDLPPLMRQGKALFSIAVRAADDGDFLDIENGDAADADAPGWWARQVARGVHRPGFYRAVSGLAALTRVLSSAGIERADYRIWSAHYDPKLGAHICSPACWAGNPTFADAAQWTDHGPWDESLCHPSILDPQEPDMSPADVQAVAQAVTSSMRVEFSPGHELFDRVVQAVNQGVKETPANVPADTA